jgi:hypothetical protein
MIAAPIDLPRVRADERPGLIAVVIAVVLLAISNERSSRARRRAVEAHPAVERRFVIRVLAHAVSVPAWLQLACFRARRASRSWRDAVAAASAPQ